VNAAKKKKPSARFLSPQKVLVVELVLFALPDAPGAYVGAVLTAAPDHKGR
jgi:hypothetical protein